MKINAINSVHFGNKSSITKKAVKSVTGLAGATLATDTFVKGISKPSKSVDENIIIAHDDPNGWNPCDNCTDALCDPTPYNKKKFEDDPCSCEEC